MEFTPISGACGAEVSGIDLERDLTPERVEALTAGLGEYGVLVFRGVVTNTDFSFANFAIFVCAPVF